MANPLATVLHSPLLFAKLASGINTNCKVFELIGDTLHQFKTQLLVGHFTSSEEYLNSYLVAISEERTDLSQLDVEVVLANLETKAHLFELTLLRILFVPL